MSDHLNNSLAEEFAPSEFYLSQNYPNPFKDKTLIKYCVARRTKVILKIYDAGDKELEKLVEEEQNPGTYEIEFQVKAGNRQMEAGDYYYSLEAGDYTCRKQMQIINY